MLTIQEFLKIIKKHYNKFFTSKQAVYCYIQERYEIEYSDLKYQNENLDSLKKESRKTVFTLLRDMQKAEIIEKYSKTTWKIK